MLNIGEAENAPPVRSLQQFVFFVPTIGVSRVAGNLLIPLSRDLDASVAYFFFRTALVASS
jgi:hypothetical protein